MRKQQKRKLRLNPSDLTKSHSVTQAGVPGCNHGSLNLELLGSSDPPTSAFAHFGRPRREDRLSPGVGDQSGQHGKTLSLQKIQKRTGHGVSTCYAGLARKRIKRRGKRKSSKRRNRRTKGRMRRRRRRWEEEKREEKEGGGGEKQGEGEEEEKEEKNKDEKKEEEEKEEEKEDKEKVEEEETPLCDYITTCLCILLSVTSQGVHGYLGGLKGSIQMLGYRLGPTARQAPGQHLVLGFRGSWSPTAASVGPDRQEGTVCECGSPTSPDPLPTLPSFWFISDKQHQQPRSEPGRCTVEPTPLAKAGLHLQGVRGTLPQCSHLGWQTCDTQQPPEARATSRYCIVHTAVCWLLGTENITSSSHQTVGVRAAFTATLDPRQQGCREQEKLQPSEIRWHGSNPHNLTLRWVHRRGKERYVQNLTHSSVTQYRKEERNEASGENLEQAACQL
ncbi:hypothetical protein AAY473_037464 [Plecturocebus cupreus]